MTRPDLEQIAREAARDVLARYDMLEDYTSTGPAEKIILRALERALAASQLECERLQIERDEARALKVPPSVDQILQANMDNAVLRQQCAAERETVEKLRKALSKIEQMPWPKSESPYAKVARAALAETEEE